MKFIRRYNLKSVFVVLAMSLALIFAPVQKANAGDPIGLGPVVPLAIIVGGILLSFVTVMGVVCTPVAAAKASDYEGGFSAAFGDCFSFDMKQTSPAEEKDNARDDVIEEKDIGEHRNVNE